MSGLKVWQRTDYPFEPSGGNIAKLHGLQTQCEYEVVSSLVIRSHSRPLSINRWLDDLVVSKGDRRGEREGR